MKTKVEVKRLQLLLLFEKIADHFLFKRGARGVKDSKTEEGEIEGEDKVEGEGGRWKARSRSTVDLPPIIPRPKNPAKLKGTRNRDSVCIFFFFFFFFFG